MAEKKCLITAQVIESDSFLTLSHSAQCLYFHYCVNADNDGFVKNPVTIMRIINAKEKDFEELSQKGYIILFDSGIIVITHWHIHNLIPKARYKPSDYIEQRAELYNKPNGAYTTNPQEGINYQIFLEDLWVKNSKSKSPTSDSLTNVEQM